MPWTKVGSLGADVNAVHPAKVETAASGSDTGVAVGNGAAASGKNSIAVGTGAVASAEGAVALGSTNARENSVDVGNRPIYSLGEGASANCAMTNGQYGAKNLRFSASSHSGATPVLVSDSQITIELPPVSLVRPYDDSDNHSLTDVVLTGGRLTVYMAEPGGNTPRLVFLPSQISVTMQDGTAVRYTFAFPASMKTIVSAAGLLGSISSPTSVSISLDAQTGVPTMFIIGQNSDSTDGFSTVYADLEVEHRG